MAEKQEYISKSLDFLDKIKSSKEVVIKFKKKDGSNRIMRCTLNFDLIPQPNRPKSLNISKIIKLLNDKGMIHVFDLDKQGWRSVTFDSSEWIETKNDNIRYKIRR